MTEHEYEKKLLDLYEKATNPGSLCLGLALRILSMLKEIDKSKEASQPNLDKFESKKGLSEIWNYKVIDNNKVPKEYLCSTGVYLEPNPSKVLSAIENGVREIPGLKIYTL